MPRRDFVESFLAKLMACNAADGAICGLPAAAEIRSAIETALDGLSQHDGPKEFMRRLRLECLGDPDMDPVPARPGDLPFATPEYGQCSEEQLSTVFTLPKFLDLIHEDDKKRLELFHGITLTSTGSSGGEALLDVFEKKNGARLAMMGEEDRRFRLSPDEYLGRPYLWFTPKNELERHFSISNATKRTRAEIARDALGLVHHKKTMYGSDKPLHLIAVHFSATVAARAGHLRPSTVQAFDHRRFVQTFPEFEPTPAGSWGQTIDLHTFRVKKDVVPIGCKERILIRLQDQILEPSEMLTFDYLGRVHSERGELETVDGDAPFLEWIRRERSIDQLVGEVWP